MENKDNQLEEFDLEDILKEFHDDRQEETSLLEEDVLVWEGITPATPPQGPENLQDTVRLDQISKAINEKTESDPMLEQTMAFTPVGQEDDYEEIVMPTAPQEPEIEPYSDQWEPQYEQPMGEYIPPEPIVFRPKSRLRELKRKLVAGPEKRYYELSELGLGKLQMAVFGNLLVALLSAGSMAMYTMGMVSQDRTRFVVFIQFLSLLLSALLGSYQLMDGFADMVRKRFSMNSLLIFSLLACLTDSVLCLYQVRIPCCAAFSLNMTMSLWSAYHKRNTEMGQMDTMRKATRLDSVTVCPDYYEGRPGFLSGDGQVEDFMDRYNAPAGPEKTLSIYAQVVLLVSIAIGVVAGVFFHPTMGVQAFAAALLVGVPSSAYITLSRPMAVMERQLHKQGAVFCGWQGIKTLSAGGVFPLDDFDLFPPGMAKMNGVKFYGQRDPDQVVAYAAALVGACGGGMEPLFTQLLDSRNGYHYELEYLRGYNGGVGGQIQEDAVLAGSLQFMQDMGVDMPEGTRVNQAIYLAIDGQLSGVFAISYAKAKSSANGLAALCAGRKLTPVLVGGDFMLTESFLRSKFGVNTRNMEFPKRETRMELLEKIPPEDAPVLALTTHDGMAGPALAVTGARSLYCATLTGVGVHMLAGILGLVMMLVLTLVGAQYLLTPANVLLYALIWMLPGLLITEWPRF